MLADPSRVRSAAVSVWIVYGNLSASMPEPGTGVVPVTTTVSTSCEEAGGVSAVCAAAGSEVLAAGMAAAANRLQKSSMQLRFGIVARARAVCHPCGRIFPNLFLADIPTPACFVIAARVYGTFSRFEILSANEEIVNLHKG